MAVLDLAQTPETLIRNCTLWRANNAPVDADVDALVSPDGVRWLDPRCGPECPPQQGPAESMTRNGTKLGRRIALDGNSNKRKPPSYQGSS